MIHTRLQGDTWENWLRQGFLHRPPAVQASKQCSLIDTNMFRPLHNRHGHVLECDEMNASPIASLDCTRCPDAVCLGVSLTVVHSFNCHTSIWSASHVRKEHYERVTPFFGHRNTATSISLIACTSVICAAVNYVAPDPVFGKMRHCVSRYALQQMFTIQAPTTSACIVYEIVTIHRPLNATLAFAPPIVLVSCFVVVMRHRPSPELSSCDVFDLRGNFVRMLCSHVRTPSMNVVRAASPNPLQAGFSHYIAL